MADAGFSFKIEEIFLLRLAVSRKGQEELVERLSGSAVFQHRIDFCPVAGGKNHRFLDSLLFIQMAKTAPGAFLRNSKLLPYVYGNGLMIQT